jgi:glycosyltransferase involved in cell wall biosynthesis
MLGGKFGLLRWNFEVAMRYYYVKAKNIIAISSYLTNYFHNKNCITVCIPPTLDVKSVKPRTSVFRKKTLTIAYSGFAGKKDLINNVIESILRLDPSGIKVKINIAGSEKNTIIKLPSFKKREITRLPKCINVLGKVSHEHAMEVVRNSDFSVLLRPRMRYSEAGFPTKITESLTVGTPVICNLTSDLGHYINDGIEGLICRDHSIEAFTEALQRALSLTTTDLISMRYAARACAERSFDYRNYNVTLNNFVESICEEKMQKNGIIAKEKIRQK